jgi:hypothetical protein
VTAVNLECLKSIFQNINRVKDPKTSNFSLQKADKAGGIIGN